MVLVPISISDLISKVITMISLNMYAHNYGEILLSMSVTVFLMLLLFL